MKSVFSPVKPGKLNQVKSAPMDDVATANMLIEEIGGRRHVRDMLYKAAIELAKRFPHREDPENKWTERRLRGWWNKESKTVRFFQMQELYVTAEEVRRARDEHANFKRQTEHLRALAELRKKAADSGMAAD